MKTLRVIQKKATCIISREFKNISETALDVECYQLSMKLALKKIVAETILRMQTISNYNIIKEIKNINESQKRVAQLAKLKSSLK